jgi:hypothetical protein
MGIKMSELRVGMLLPAMVVLEKFATLHSKRPCAKAKGVAQIARNWICGSPLLCECISKGARQIWLASHSTRRQHDAYSLAIVHCMTLYMYSLLM